MDGISLPMVNAQHLLTYCKLCSILRRETERQCDTRHNNISPVNRLK